MTNNERPALEPETDVNDPRYRRAARLLAQKLGVDRRELPPEQVREYLRKIEIARQKPDARGDDLPKHSGK